MWRNKLDKQFWIFTGHQCGCAQCTATGGQEILGNHADSDRFIVRRTPRYALTVMVFDCLTVRSVDRKHDNPKDMQDFHLDSRSVHETFGILVLQISSNSFVVSHPVVLVGFGTDEGFDVVFSLRFCNFLWFCMSKTLLTSWHCQGQEVLGKGAQPAESRHGIGASPCCGGGGKIVWELGLVTFWSFFSLKCFVKTMVIHQWGHHLIFGFHECPCCHQLIFR